MSQTLVVKETAQPQPMGPWCRGASRTGLLSERLEGKRGKSTSSVTAAPPVTLHQSNITSLWLCSPSLWSCCGFVDKLHVTLPADILISAGRIKWPPIFSSQKGNGLMASMYAAEKVWRLCCVCVCVCIQGNLCYYISILVCNDLVYWALNFWGFCAHLSFCHNSKMYVWMWIGVSDLSVQPLCYLFRPGLLSTAVCVFHVCTCSSGSAVAPVDPRGADFTSVFHWLLTEKPEETRYNDAAVKLYKWFVVVAEGTADTKVWNVNAAQWRARGNLQDRVHYSAAPLIISVLNTTM